MLCKFGDMLCNRLFVIFIKYACSIIVVIIININIITTTTIIGKTALFEP
jgi:hypothetical protein